MPPVEKPPTPTTSSSWTSAAWSNGKERTLKSDQTDPYDPRFGVRHPGNPIAVIDGKGICAVSGNSPRIEVKGEWTNTELTVYVNQTSIRSITLHARSAEIEKQESAYGSHFEEGGQSWVKKEAGNEYSDRIGSVAGPPITKSKWIGLRQVCKDVSDGVLIENWMDSGDGKGWQKVTSAVDTGEWEGAPLHSGTQCYVRTNDSIDTKYKDYAVRIL